MTLGLREELAFFAVEFACISILICFFSSWTVSSRSGIEVSSSLTRFDRRGVEGPETSSSSNSVTEEVKALELEVSLEVPDGALRFIGNRKGKLRDKEIKYRLADRKNGDDVTCVTALT